MTKQLCRIPKSSFLDCFKDFQQCWKRYIDAGRSYFIGDTYHQSISTPHLFLDCQSQNFPDTGCCSSSSSNSIIVVVVGCCYSSSSRSVYLLSVAKLRTSSAQTAFANPFNNFKRYGKILSRCCNPDSSKYMPRAITASCPL